MRKIVYIGLKPLKVDNIAKTGLSWTPGQIQEVEDLEKAEKLLEYGNVWADAEKPYDMQKVTLQLVEEKQEDFTVHIAPQGGEPASSLWEPIEIKVTGDVFKKLQDNEMTAVIMTNEDADAFSIWKKSPPVSEVAEEVKRRLGRPKKVA